MLELIQFIPLFPLIGFLFLGLFGSYIKNEKLIGIIGSGMILISFVITLTVLNAFLATGGEQAHIVNVFEWIAAGDFAVNISYQVDQLSLLFSCIITGVGFLIHIYSIGYMHGDRSFYRFFASLNLFVFMMLNLVLASNFMLTFLGWEGVGLASYLLIGFWYDQKFDGYRITWTGDAANKAFIVNRIGDFGMLIAIFLTFVTFGTLEYTEVSAMAMENADSLMGGGMILAITLLIFLACTGKSAQIPLAGWLPDAMAGPTSVSALIHAATMVTAGIFLIARNSVLFALSPTSMAVVAAVGATTALIAASIGLVQNDIKKVLAYSTVSQLGFMFTALGVGAFDAGLFHTMTHAFFKALLFLAAGSVIHGMHHEQDIKKMGGLKKYMPITYKTFFVGTLAIAGIPFFSGFFSKDEILWQAFNSDNGSIVVYIMLAVAAIFTAFYMFRLLYLTFTGKERFDASHVHPHESPSTMTSVLIVLAILSAIGGFLNVPYPLGYFFSDHPSIMSNYLAPIFSDANILLGKSMGHEVHAIEYVLMAVATGLAFLSWFVAKKWYNTDETWATPRALVQKYPKIYNLLWEKWFLDQAYYKGFVDPIITTSRSFLWKIVDVNIVDGFVNGIAKLVELFGKLIRGLQSGITQSYAGLMVLGLILILIIMAM